MTHFKNWKDIEKLSKKPIKTIIDEYEEVSNIWNDQDWDEISFGLKCYRKGKQEIKKEFIFKIKQLRIDLEKHWDKVANPKKNILVALKQLEKEI